MNDCQNTTNSYMESLKISTQTTCITTNNSFENYRISAICSLWKRHARPYVNVKLNATPCKKNVWICQKKYLFVSYVQASLPRFVCTLVIICAYATFVKIDILNDHPMRTVQCVEQRWMNLYRSTARESHVTSCKETRVAQSQVHKTTFDIEIDRRRWKQKSVVSHSVVFENAMSAEHVDSANHPHTNAQITDLSVISDTCPHMIV